MANGSISATDRATIASLPSNTAMDKALRPFAMRVHGLRFGRRFFLAAACLLGVWLLAMWSDLIWPLPVTFRWFVSRIVPFLLLAWLLIVEWRVRRRTSMVAIAGHIDQLAGTGGKILTGCELARLDSSMAAPIKQSSGNVAFVRKPDPMSMGLASLAVEQSLALVQSLNPFHVVPGKPLRIAARWLLGSLGLLVVLSLILPSLAYTQWQRLLFPMNDTPPYTGILIDLEPLSGTVTYGEDFRLNAKVLMGEANKLQVVTLTEDGREHVIPMLPQKSGEWLASLHHVTQPLRYYVRSSDTQSKTGSLQVRMVPKITQSRVRMTYPQYTRRSPYQGPIPEEGVNGLKGTVVRWSVMSNRPLDHGLVEFQFRDGSRHSLELQPEAAEEDAAGFTTLVAGDYTLSQSGRFSIRVVDIDRNVSEDHVDGVITVIPDQRPNVRIVEPKPLSYATPEVNLPVVILAEDDFGIQNLQWFRSLNGSAFLPTSIPVTGDPQQQSVMELALPRYGLEEGDEIQLFARVEDNDPAGAKGAESPITVVRIISIQSFQEMAMQQRGIEAMAAKYQAAERQMENLAEALREADEAAKQAEADPGSEAAQQALQQSLQRAADAAKQVAEELAKLGSQPMPVDVDQELSEELKKLAEQTRESAEKLEALRQAHQENGELDEQERQELEALRDQVAGERENLEANAVKPMEALKQTMPLMLDQQRFEQIVAQQKDLAQRMESLRGADPNDPQTQRRAAEHDDEQARLQEALEELLDDIEAHADSLPADPELDQLRETAQAFAQAIDESRASQEMLKAQQELRRDQFGEAADAAKHAADLLESFLGESEEMGKAGEKACKASFNPKKGQPKLGDSLKQLQKMMGKGKGSKPGQNPGNAPGQGEGSSEGSSSQRSPSPQNVGLYGALPTTQPRESRGRGDKKQSGSATTARYHDQAGGESDTGSAVQGATSGAADANIPSQYRGRVNEYLQKLSEQLGKEP